MTNNRCIEKHISIVLSGEAGQGLQTIEKLFSRVVKNAGYHVFAYSELMSRIRGGNNSTQIRVSSRRIAAPVDKIDIFIPLNEHALKRFQNKISSGTIIIADEMIIDSGFKEVSSSVISLPLVKISKEIGGVIYINTIILGIISSLLKIEQKDVSTVMKENFNKLDDALIEKNMTAVQAGYNLEKDVVSEKISVSIDTSDLLENELLLSGSESIGIGSLSGGCDFISSYPMSPSTSVLVFLAKYSKEFDVVVEQAEDEICAINMALGAWYAGARALVSTSGGGFALMTEGLSLAGCIESPLVIHLGQRPGPATGLPTRTEQGDLLMTVFAGHGEFPRVILAPGSRTEGIELSCQAFNIADKYQVPVFILTDQYFLDSSGNSINPDSSILKAERYIVETSGNYKRYSYTQNGVSLRGIPGFGKGIVCVDSDEHDEAGYITEDFDTRTHMVNKRIKKLEALQQDVIEPKLVGKEDYRYLIVGWGSTYGAGVEALEVLGRRDISYLHFSQIFPLHRDTADLIKRAEKKIIIENNETAQFGNIIKMVTGVEFDKKIIKYNGLPFSVEDIVDAVQEFL